jgi:phosphatidylglycerophosphatase A
LGAENRGHRVLILALATWGGVGFLPFMPGTWGTLAALPLDHPAIVVDEVAGLLITMAGLPPTWEYAVLGLVIFRALDILKPFPIRWFQEGGRGGLEVMADDVAAGVIGRVIVEVVSVMMIRGGG